MAKNTQEAEVIVTMNGQAAKKAVAELAQEYEKLQKEALEAYKAGNDALGKKLDAQAQKLMKDIEITRRETKKFADVMKNINGASLKELNSAAKQLRSEINKLTPGTQEFITKSKQLQEVNTRINQLKGSFKGLVAEEKAATITLKGLSEGFNRYFGMITAGIAAITGVSMALKKCAQDAAAMDDAYATVMKTTSLTHEEVEQLNDSFKRMDTRTAREELNKMAYEAGKLGFTGVENIRQFVEAADVINVALGDVLGEGATLEIAKLAQVFAQSTAALDNLDLKGRMLAVGSAVNQLGKESTASESYMVDFLGRLGGVATQAGISADQILGYASALDQMKQKVEMSATAFQKLIQQMIKKPEEFVEAARMPLDEFTKMMETDMNGAIKRVLEGFNQMGGFTQLVPVFKDMGLDGARAASVIAALAANLDKVSAAQATANEHIRLGTSMTREYNIMNTSMQAKLEKARKEFKDICIELGQRLNPVMLKSTKGVTYLIKILATYGKEIKAAVLSVVLFTAAVKAHSIAHAAMNVVTKTGMTLKATYKTIVLALRVAYLKLTGQMEAAAAAQLELTAAMSTNVFGLIATAIATLTVAIVHFTKETKKANEVTEKMEEVQKRINSEYAEEAGRVQALNNIVHNNSIEIDQRRRALEELKKIVPEYHADLTKEGKLIKDNTDALADYIKNLEISTRARVLDDEYYKAVSATLEAEKNLEIAKQKTQDALIAANGNTATISGITMQSSAGAYSNRQVTPYGQALKDEKDAQEDLNKAKAFQEELEKRIGKEHIKTSSDAKKALEEEGDAVEDTTAKYENLSDAKNGKKEESPYQKALKDLEKAQRNEENTLKQSYINREITTEEYEKSMREINLKYLQEKVGLAKEFGEDETSAVSAWLNAQITAVDMANKEIDALLKQREDWEKAQQAELEAYQKKLEELKEEAEKVRDWLDPSAAKMKDLDDELATLKDLHQAKLLSEEEYERAVKKLRKQYADEDLKEKLENVQKYCERANSIMEQASNFVTALKEAESAKLEAQYQADLTAAGDNAEQREQIEADYEQKKLDLQKKYADTEMVINIAKAIAAGALAAIEAFAAAGNPILGAVFAAIIAATTALEVATIVKQRNAIKNTSVGGGGSSSVPKTGERKMTGYAEGGYTEDHTTLTTVGEKGREWVGPAWMVRKNPVMFANLERYRKSGSHGRSGSMSRGFADGGFTPGKGGGPSAAMPEQIDIEAAVEAAIRRVMADGAIRAYVVRKDIEELDAQTLKFKKLGSR